MRFFRYIHYRLRAKGRHGTHSPFVYSLVENVLRNADSDKIKILIEVLNPKKVFMLATHEKENGALSAKNEVDYFLEEGNLMIVSMNKIPDRDKLMKISFPVTGGLIILHPHIHSHTTKIWQELVARPDIKMSLDCWSWGLLINDKAFKEKQHFYLR